MTIGLTHVDSLSVGDPARFLTLADLERGLDRLTPPARGAGQVVLIVRRGASGLRQVLDRTELSSGAGVVGDAWGRRPERNPAMQISVMQADVAAVIAYGQPLTLFGDNLFLELDLSARNLPAGSRVRAGGAVLEVTPMPHNGCRKFQARFGEDALHFVSRKEQRHRNLRGIYMQVIEPGDVQSGDAVHVLARAPYAQLGLVPD